MVVRQTRLLGFELGRLAGAVSAPPLEGGGIKHVPHEAALAGLDHAAGRLDAQLFGPLRRLIDGRELVLAPADALHGLAWATLPSLAGRPVTVVGSAAAWLSRTETPRGGLTVLAAGPGPVHGPAEVRPALYARRIRHW